MHERRNSNGLIDPTPAPKHGTTGLTLAPLTTSAGERSEVQVNRLANSEASATGVSAVLGQADALLAQVESLLDRLSAEHYSTSCPAVFASSIGQHTRHLLDHFAALVAGAHDDPAGAGCVDYDHRERATPVELDPLAARAETARLRAELRGRCGAACDRSVRVRAMMAADGRCVEIGSTFVRELAFASHHTLHHQAMIRLIAESMGIALEPSFGKAPSTLHHETSQRG